MDADSLSSVFGKSCTEVSDMIAEIVHKHDPDVSSMYVSGGRESYQSHQRFNNAYHSYGGQLGWHGLTYCCG